MNKKRTILIVGIIAGSILLIGPFGLSPAFLIAGVVLSIIIGQKGDRAAVELIQRGHVKITEIKMPPPKTKTQPAQPERVMPDAPTVYDLSAHQPILTPTETLEPMPETEPPFIIGKTEDGRTITLDKISSMGVGGKPGSGKTVAMVGLVAQSAVKYRGDVRALCIDPHMRSGSPEALSARMAPLAPFYLNVPNLPNPVYGGADLLKWIEWLTKQAYARIGGEVARDQQFKIVVVADEFTALMDDEEIAGPLTELLLLINEQARKVNMFALVASPQWKSDRIGGTNVRNVISSWLVHNMSPNIARQLIPFAVAEKSNTLDEGQAIFERWGKTEVVRVPFMTPKQIADCVRPYLPATPSQPEEAMEELQPRQVVGVLEPTIAEIRKVWDAYQVANKEFDYSEDGVILGLAVVLYPGDPCGEDRVRRALELGQEHL